MFDKTVSVDELLRLVQDGATVKTERHPMVIDQFNLLIAKLDEIAKANEARAAADLARSQTQLEVLATLQQLVRRQTGVNRSPPLDLKPLQTVLTDIQKASEEKPRVAYEFDVQRNLNGGIARIVATPQERMTH